MHKIIIMCGPTGVGKTTIAKELFKLFPTLKPSVTYSTRPPRPSAIEDKKMIHISEEEFLQKKKNGDFLEDAKVHGNYYGTAKKETLELIKTNSVLFNIDINGEELIKQQFPGQCITIFILPESMEQLVSHVKKRGEISNEELQTRLETAKKELKKTNLFDYTIINHEGKLEETIKKVAEIVKKM